MSLAQFSLADRVAIVTGAGRGIGKAIALGLADAGATVVVAARTASDIENTAEEIQKKGKKALAMPTDVRLIDQVNNLVEKTVNKFGKIDILVNNAGGISLATGGSIENTTEEDWDRIVGINLKGQFLCCRAVVPYMKRNKYGKIINVSSMGAIHPPAPIVHYHAAKGGVLGLTNNLAFELATSNITVNAILPGPIRSEFFNEMLKGMTKKEGEAFFAMLDKRVPMQRMGTPAEVAGVALFLASELSSYVTGEAICVGGGLPLTPA
jgi:NAD(P)-dependent dehydrogenase (short-subunit alcohol dehydrogenase family)